MFKKKLKYGLAFKKHFAFWFLNKVKTIVQRFRSRSKTFLIIAFFQNHWYEFICEFTYEFISLFSLWYWTLPTNLIMRWSNLDCFQPLVATSSQQVRKNILDWISYIVEPSTGRFLIYFTWGKKKVENK